MLRFLAQTCYDYPSLASTSGRAQLVTISYSHYNELARWALELNKTPFIEHGFAPGQHALPALSVRVARSGKRHMATSSSMNGSTGKASPTALPVLVCPDGTVRKDSWEIAASTSLAPIDPALRIILDVQVGCLGRKFAYCVLLKRKHAARFTTMCTEGRHWGWRLLWHMGVGAALRRVLSKAFRPDDVPGFAACVEQLEALFAPSGPLATALAAARLAGHPYLGGHLPGQADIALASMGALVVLPDEYGGRQGTMGPHFAYLREHDEEARAIVARFRETDVGKFVLDMYARHRL